jgi:plastocyanin
MTRRSSLALSLLALGALIAGCGGNSAKKQAGPATATASAPTGGTVNVSMRNIRFVPAHITVKSGQTIKWTNDDPVAHTVTADKGATLNSGNINAGQTYAFTPTTPGTIHYYCTIHGQIQSGTITITR